MRVLFFYCKTCFQKGNLTQILAEVRRIYMVLFGSPSDRKQIDIIAERIFAKDRPNFMNLYGSVSAKPYGYVLVDNQPKTTTDKQVVPTSLVTVKATLTSLKVHTQLQR